MASNSTHVLISAHLATKWGWKRKIKLGVNESTDGSRGWKNVISNGGIPGAVAIFAFIIQDWTITYYFTFRQFVLLLQILGHPNLVLLIQESN